MKKNVQPESSAAAYYFTHRDKSEQKTSLWSSIKIKCSRSELFADYSFLT
jgi:hypothetical protein